MAKQSGEWEWMPRVCCVCGCKIVVTGKNRTGGAFHLDDLTGEAESTCLRRECVQARHERRLAAKA